MDVCIDQSDIVCPLFSYFDKMLTGKKVCVLLEFLTLRTPQQFIYTLPL